MIRVPALIRAFYNPTLSELENETYKSFFIIQLNLNVENNLMNSTQVEKL